MCVVWHAKIMCSEQRDKTKTTPDFSLNLATLKGFTNVQWIEFCYALFQNYSFVLYI
jgi:hypothetical protein